MRSASREFMHQNSENPWRMYHSWQGIHNITQEVNRIRLLGKFTMDEIDKAIEEVTEGIDLLNTETNDQNLLRVEDIFRQAAKRIHNARVCKPSEEEMRNLIIFNQELRRQVKGEPKGKKYFKMY